MNVPKKQSTIYLGSFPFGAYQEKLLTVNTWSNAVYVHIKDRSRGKNISFKSSDYLQLLRLKTQVVNLIEKGNKALLKNQEEDKQLSASEPEDDEQSDLNVFSESEDDDLNKIVDNIRSQQSKNKKKRKMNLPLDLSDNEMDVKKQPKKSKVTKNLCNDGTAELTKKVKSPEKSKSTKKRPTKPSKQKKYSTISASSESESDDNTSNSSRISKLKRQKPITKKKGIANFSPIALHSQESQPLI